VGEEGEQEVVGGGDGESEWGVEAEEVRGVWPYRERS
jgi:hypothetical protein